MTIRVKKRDGRREDFVVEKVVVSMVKAGAPVEVAREIAGKVEAEAKEGMATEEIRSVVLGELRRRDPEWERNWLIYDRAVKKRF